jgi:hypothetical protein
LNWVARTTSAMTAPRAKVARKMKLFRIMDVVRD